MEEDYTGKILLNRFRVDDLLHMGRYYGRYRGFDLKRNLGLMIRIYPIRIEEDSGVLCFQSSNLTYQSFSHPTITPFYGLYQDGGQSFVIEKYIEGQTLAQILRQRRGKPFPPEEALVYLKTVATALDYLHGYGLVHSTLDFENLLAQRDGSLLLANFGFARFMDKPMSTSGVFGPPLGLAPEQLRGERVYPSTDIYTLGILFFEFLTGVHPFLQAPSHTVEDETDLEARLREAHLNQSPPDMAQFNRNLPSGISQTVLTALAKDPKERYQSATEMLEVSCAVLGTSPRQVPDRIGASGPPPTTMPSHREAASGAPAGVSPTAYAPPPSSGVQPTAYTPPPSSGVQPTAYAPPPAGVPPTAAYAHPAGVASAPGSGYPPPLASQSGPYSTSGADPWYPVEERRKRPAWLLPAIGLIVLAMLLCGVVGVWAGLPILQNMLASATPTLTATPTEEPTATSAPPTATIPSALPPTEAPPTEPPPTEPPLVLPTFPPTEPPTPTAARSAFRVTIRNNQGYPIFPFRNGTLMGRDPIPTGRFIWYLNIPVGEHYFEFCRDEFRNDCPVNRWVQVDQDVTISVP